MPEIRRHYDRVSIPPNRGGIVYEETLCQRYDAAVSHRVVGFKVAAGVHH